MDQHSKPVLVHLVGVGEQSDHDAGEITAFGHVVTPIRDYRIAADQVARNWADYIVTYAVNQAELSEWERFAKAFGTYRDRSGCDSKLCLCVPVLTKHTAEIANKNRSRLLAQEFGISIANYIQLLEHNRAVARMGRPCVFVKHGYRGQRSAFCGVDERLRSAVLSDGRYEVTASFTGLGLAIVDVFVRFGPVLRFDDVADMLNTDELYRQNLNRIVSDRALPMAVSRLNVMAAWSLNLQPSDFTLVGPARGRTGHHELRAEGDVKHVRLD